MNKYIINIICFGFCSLLFANAPSIQENEYPSIIGGSGSVKEAFQYPKLLTNQHSYISGKSIAEFLIKNDGTVSDVKIIKSLGPAFDEVMVKGINQLKFIPASVNGQPISVRYKLPIIFNK